MCSRYGERFSIFFIVFFIKAHALNNAGSPQMAIQFEMQCHTLCFCFLFEIMFL